MDPLSRIAHALERLAPPPPPAADPFAADAFVWAASGALRPVREVARVELGLLLGIDRAKATLLANTRQFAAAGSANHAMLWGARGMGKSSLVKAVHASVNAECPRALALVEIHREELASLPALLAVLRGWKRRCIVFCDDLSFEREDADYKALKSVLEGGIEGSPANLLFYATSNRRHLMPREMVENEQGNAINPAEATEEKVSLSDRFGLWLGFHACDQATYRRIVQAYADRFGLDVAMADADAWAMARGARSGRVAWQYIRDVQGRNE